MAFDQKQMRIPGPTPVPHEVAAASARPMVNHRGPVFKKVMMDVLERLKPIFQTQNTILALTGSGTSAMEASVANLVNPDDEVLVLVGGTFGERWAKICRAYQAKVHVLDYTWGEGADPAQIADFLRRNPRTVAVFATHNESSTGVLNDLEGIGAAVRESGALLVVDAVSSLGGVELKTDAWGIDVVCTASQKCLMAPPGLAFLSLSQRAEQRVFEVSSPRFYFDLRVYLEWLKKHELPFTPNISCFFALEKSLSLIESEGLGSVFARHLLLRDMVRAGLQALDLPLLVEDKWASPTVTAVKPGFSDIGRFLAALRETGVELAGGQGRLAGQIFRIGHMGSAAPVDMLATLAAIEAQLGGGGKAVSAAEQVWNRARQGKHVGGQGSEGHFI